MAKNVMQPEFLKLCSWSFQFVQRFSFTHRWCSLETRRGTSMTSGMATKFVVSKRTHVLMYVLMKLYYTQATTATQA